MRYLSYGIIVILAALLDLWLMRVWGRQNHSRDRQEADSRFYLWGRYSPLLTGLFRRIPRLGQVLTGRSFAAQPGEPASGIVKDAERPESRVYFSAGITLVVLGVILEAVCWTLTVLLKPSVVKAALLPNSIKSILMLMAGWGYFSLILGAVLLAMKRLPGWLDDWLQSASRWLGVQLWQFFCLVFSPFFVIVAALLGSGRFNRLPYPGIAIPAWLVGIGLAIVGSLGQPSKPRLARPVVILFVLLVAFALIVRAVDTTHIPVTLTGDEGETGLNALAFREGNVNNIFGTGWRGFPALYFFLQSLPIAVFGHTAAALRITSALGGALTVGAVFIFGSALFGRRTGLLAAIFLSALHFHVHFSRIGLNNIWDGLAFIVVLGALWAGWQTRKRGYFVLAGIGLGFAQYFYVSSRVLVVLVVAWLFLAILFSTLKDRSRIKAVLPGLVVMIVIAGVIALPLGWFYARHPNELTVSIQAQSIFGSWMKSAEQSTGKSELRIVADQIVLGLRGYISAPLKWFYRPNVPILRSIPAVLFVLGLIFLFLRPLDLRTSLLALWLLAFGFVGGFSESTPAAQRYVAAAPACALMVGYGEAQLAATLAHAWPRVKVGLGVAAILFVVLPSLDELRFYFLEYVPNSYFQGKYDFEGYGSAATTRLAYYLLGYGGKDFIANNWQVMFYGPPDLEYYTIPTMLYLTPSIKGVNVPAPYGDPSNPVPQTPDQIYVFLPHRQADLPLVQAAQPGGRLVTELGDKGELLYTLYQAPPEPASHPYISAKGKSGLLQPTLVWAGIFVILAGLVLAWLLRIRPGWRWLEDGTEDIALLSLWTPLIKRMKSSMITMPEANPSQSILDSSGSQELPASEITPVPQPAEQLPSPDPIPSKAEEPVSPQPVQLTVNPGEGFTSPALHSARVNISVDIPEGMTVQVTVTGMAAGQPPAVNQYRFGSLPEAPALPIPVTKAPVAALCLKRRLSLSIGTWALSPTQVFWLAMLVYMATRLIGIERWPIYFFTDEAVQTVMASDFTHQGFKNYDHEAWPTYFNNGSTFNLSSVSVYVQVIPYLLFGKSVFVTRAVSALIGALAAVAVGLILRMIFKIRFWWIGVLLLSITPAWFLHSRTAFETVEMTGFYALFLFFYLLYRHRNPWYLYASLFFGALVFYTYSPGALIMVTSGVLLLLSDLAYHVKHWKYALLGLLLLGLLAVPYLRYTAAHPGVTKEQLCTRATYWCEPGSLISKVGHYLNEYKRGFSLSYWYIPNRIDLDRHLMKGYGHLLGITAPFMLIGLAVTLWNFHSSAYRALLIALLAAPTGSALVQIGITRALVFVVPITLLTAIGLVKALEFLIDPIGQLRAVRPPGFLAWFGQAGIKLAEQPMFAGPLNGWREPHPVSARTVGVVMFVILVGANFFMLGDALLKGPTWFQQYDMGGMQYGAIPLFREVKQYIQEHPDLHLMVSPDWANGTDVVARFFFSNPLPFDMGSYKGYENSYNPDLKNRAFVLIPAEWDEASTSNKFTNIQVDKILNYPNGQPGFYFVRMQYAANVEQIMQSEVEARKQLQEAYITLDGAPVKVKYSTLDMGLIDNLFDGSKQTLVRTMEANPFVLEMDFSNPRPISGIAATVGAMQAEIIVRATTPDGQVKEYQTVFNSTPENQTTEIDFEQSWSVQTLNIDVRNMNTGEPANVHVYEIQLK